MQISSIGNDQGVDESQLMRLLIEGGTVFGPKLRAKKSVRISREKGSPKKQGEQRCSDVVFLKLW